MTLALASMASEPIPSLPYMITVETPDARWAETGRYAHTSSLSHTSTRAPLHRSRFRPDHHHHHHHCHHSHHHSHSHGHSRCHQYRSDLLLLFVSSSSSEAGGGGSTEFAPISKKKKSRELMEAEATILEKEELDLEAALKAMRKRKPRA